MFEADHTDPDKRQRSCDGNAPTLMPKKRGAWLCLAIFAGILTGLAETAWIYMWPAFGARIRPTVPLTPPGVLRVALAAIATDIPVVLCAMGLATGSLALLRRAGIDRTRKRSHLARTWLTFAIIGAYLVGGWTFLFVISTRHMSTGELTGWLALIVVASLTLTLPIVWTTKLLLARKRTAWLPPVLFAIAYMVLMLAAAKRYPIPQGEIKHAIASAASAPNVLLITLDTLRVDHLGCYGNDWIDTPNLDALAKHSVLFDQAISQAPSTAPSHASIMTSRYPFDHESENGRPMRTGLVTIADTLQARGYETIAFTSATTTRSLNSGLNQGFDNYVDSLVPWSTLFGRDEFQHLILFHIAGVLQHSQIAGEIVSRRAVDWINRRNDVPFFCWLHYFDPHSPYGSPPPFRGMYNDRLSDDNEMLGERRQYAEDVSYVDHQVGVVLEAIRSKSLYDNTLIIVTSDHGEAFGERHGDVVERGHGRYLYDTTQHVPLMIKPAGVVESHRVTAQVELIDLAPTVLAELQFDPELSFAGKSLADHLHEASSDPSDHVARSFSVARHVPNDNPHTVLFVQQLATRQPPFKYITIPRLGQSQLFNLADDPGERVNIASMQSQTAQALHDEIVEYWESDRDPTLHPASMISPALVKELRSLGYLGGDDEPQDAE